MVKKTTQKIIFYKDSTYLYTCNQLFGFNNSIYLFILCARTETRHFKIQKLFYLNTF